MRPEEAVSHRLRRDSLTVTVGRVAAPLSQCRGEKTPISAGSEQRSPGHHSQEVQQDAWHTGKWYLHSNTEDAPVPSRRSLGWENESSELDLRWGFWVGGSTTNSSLWG